MGSFRYAAAVLERFPGTRGGVVYADGLDNGPAPTALGERFRHEQEQVIARIGDTPLSEIPSLAAWRRVFGGFGAAPTKYRNAAEALARRLTKRGDIPSINTLVDIANLVSIRRGLPVAVFDQAPVTGSTTVRFAEGDERFTDLGDTEVAAPEPGEVIFVDDAGLVSARRWCWRQSSQSAAGPSTAAALLTVEGQHETAGDDVAAAVEDLRRLLVEFQPGVSLDHDLLSAERPAFDW